MTKEKGYLKRKLKKVYTHGCWSAFASSRNTIIESNAWKTRDISKNTPFKLPSSHSIKGKALTRSDIDAQTHIMVSVGLANLQGNALYFEVTRKGGFVHVHQKSFTSPHILKEAGGFNLTFIRNSNSSAWNRSLPPPTFTLIQFARRFVIKRSPCQHGNTRSSSIPPY